MQLHSQFSTKMPLLFFFLASVAYLCFFSPPFVDTFDNAILLQSINHGYLDTGIGRHGFVYFFHWAFQIGQHFFDINIIQFQYFIQWMNIFVSAGTVVTFAALLSSLSGSLLLGLAGGLALLSNEYIFYLGTSYGTDLFAFFFVLLAFFLCTKFLEFKKVRHLYFSAICFGYACVSREQSYFFSAFFFLIWVTHTEILKTHWRHWAAASSIALAIGFSGPLYSIYDMGWESFLNRITYFSSGMSTEENLGIFVKIRLWFLSFTQNTLGYFSYVFIALGLLAIWSQRRQQKALVTLSLALALSAVPLILLTSSAAFSEVRHQVGTKVLMIMLLTLGTHFLLQKLPFSLAKRNILLVLLALSFSTFNLNFNYHLVHHRNWAANDYKSYWESKKLFCEPKCLFLVGHRFPFALLHNFVFQSHLPHEVIHSGWDWPGAQLTAKLADHLERGYSIVVDFEGFYMENEISDVKKSLSELGVTLGDRKYLVIRPNLP